MTDFPKPRINLNGTDAATLRREYMAAYDAIKAAEQAIRQITIHDRDYHLISRTAGAEARQRRVEWLLALDAIQQDISEVVLHLDWRGSSNEHR